MIIKPHGTIVIIVIVIANGMGQVDLCITSYQTPTVPLSQRHGHSHSPSHRDWHTMAMSLAWVK